MDDLGIPGCLVATTEFMAAAEAQSSSLGFDPAVVWVDHPVQNRTPEELEALADGAIDAILEVLVSPPG